MASSGTYTLDKTALDIIKKALLLCKAYDPNQSLSDDDVSTCMDSLNYMIKQWDSQGFHLWTNEDAVLFLVKSQKSYLIGPTAANCCNSDDFIFTTIDVAGIASDESITVADSTGMEGAPDIFDTNQAVDVNAWTATNSTIAVASSKLTITNSGAASGYADLSLTGLIVGSSYRLTYGYEVGTSTSATFSVISDSVAIATDTQTVTGTYTLDFTATQENADFRAENVSTTASHTTLVTAANYVDKSAGDYAGIYLDDTTMQWLNIVSVTGNVLYLNGGLTSATAIGNYVYTYSDKIQRPLRVQDQRYQVNIIQDEIPVQKMSRKDYLNQTDKSTAGTVSQAYYNPKLVNGQLSVWQTSDSNLSLLRFSYNNPLEIFDTNQNTPNFPSEWYLPCAYNLAAIIAPEYKASESNQMILEKKASQFLQDALAFDDEMVSMFVQPDDS